MNYSEIKLNLKESKMESKMTNGVLGKIDFGPIDGNQFRMSPKGMAVKSKDGSWVVYNSETDSVENVLSFTFDMEDMFFKMPVGQISIGDIILHKGDPVCVMSEVLDKKTESKKFSAYNYLRSEQVIIYPETILGGFQVYTKIVSLLNLTSSSNSGINPMMMMMMMKKDSSNDMGDMMKNMMLMNYMNAGANPNDLTNMLPLMFLSSGNNSDPIEMMIMMSMFGNSGGLFGSPSPVKTANVPEENQKPQKKVLNENKKTNKKEEMQESLD